MEDDLINNLIQTDFISLKGEDLSKYNFEDILQESINPEPNLVNKIITPNDNNKNEESKLNNKISRKSSSSSSEDSSLTIKEIPREYLENPIDFVNYFENELPNEKINKRNDKFILKSFDERNDIKFEIMNIYTDKEINRIIFSPNELITSIFYFGQDFLITGNFLGQIKIFSLFDKKQIKFIESPFLKENNNIQITAIDLTKDNKNIFIGYSNGNISFAEIKSQRIKLVINDIIKNNECLCVKFINQEGKFYRIIASDQLGNGFLIRIKDGFTGCRVVESRIIYESNDKYNPIYFIKILEFNKEMTEKNSFLKNINEYIILGSLENISIFTLINNSKLDLKYKIEKPEWITDNIISDVCFGTGQNPQEREDLEENEDIPQILMCACFDEVINLYIIPIDNEEITYPILIGHYLNINDEGDNQIVRIGFLSKGCIFLIDKSNHFKIINTKKFIKGIPNINKETSINIKDIKSKYKKSEIQEVFIFKSDINYQINIKSSENNYKQNYINSIVQNFESNNLEILCNNNLYTIDFINYDFCLKKLQQKEQWLEMFILGIEIYKGKITTLKGIPQNPEERKNKLRDFLEQLILVYIIADDLNQKKDNTDSFYENQKFLKHTENKIEIIIEFCMEIEGFDFLLDKIFKNYESKKFENLFLTKLEAFIMCDKLLNYEINEDLIIKLIELYEEKNKIRTLDKLLLHIDNNTLNSPVVKSKIQELNLFSPMISIFVNGKNPDYFKPVLLLYEKYEKSEKLNYISYEKIIEKKSIEEIRESKEYKGHKVFWYIYKSFTKRKFPYFINNMEDKYYNNYIIDLIFWLMKENIMKNLIELNSEIYFEILNKIFNEQKNLNIIKSLNNEKEEDKRINKLNEQNYNYIYKDLSPINLLNYIIEQGKKIEGEQQMKLDFNLFIIQCHKIICSQKDIIINSIIFILDVYVIVYKKIDNKTKRIIMIINNILSNTELFSDGDYGNILMHFNSHIFDEIKAFIYLKTKKYKNCLEVFFDEKCLINNKEDKLKEYIYIIFHSLERDKDNKQAYLDYKNLIMENIANIGEISSDVMTNIIFDYFYQNTQSKKLIIEKLDKKPKLQLLFIEPIYHQYIDYNQENQNKIIMNDDELEIVQLILGMYIKLLCITGQKEKVLFSLKESNLFPYDLCLKICEEYDIKDALIYLYLISGDFQSAFKINNEIIDINFTLITKNLISDIFINKDFLEQINNFNDSIEQNLEILTEIQNHKTDEEKELSQSNKEWFDTLNKLYDFSIKFEKVYETSSLNDKNERIKSYFEENLLEDIKLALEKMSPFINIKLILEEVSKHEIAGYKEFKSLLNKIFESYDIQNSILLYSTNLIKNLCFESLSKFKEKNKEGGFIDINKCFICKEDFKKIINENDKKILVFNCGHKIHLKCSKTITLNNEEKIICPICIKKEIDLDVFHLNEIKINETKINKRKREIKLNKDNIDLSMYRKGFIRMYDINKNLMTNNKNFFRDCINARERLRNIKNYTKK